MTSADRWRIRVNTGLRTCYSMVKLSKTRFWDVFSTFAYILAFLITMVAVVGLAIFVMNF